MTKHTELIGTKFQSRKSRNIATVVDILTTTNMNGDIVKYTYIAQETFLGQVIRFEIPLSTIMRHQIKDN